MLTEGNTMIGKQHMLACFYLLLLYVLLLSSDGSIVDAKKPQGFVAKLFHHDSVHSPFYNPNETLADRAKRATESSLARFAYLMASATSSNTTFETDYYESPLKWFENGKSIYANISVGQPPVVQFVILDSGSSLLWVQCEPCISCSNQSGPVFNSGRSSTYSKVPFASDICVSDPDLLPQESTYGDCIYNKYYQDQSKSRGFLSKETLTFSTYEDGLATLPDVVFGCGIINNANIGQSSGVLGVGTSKISLISQFGFNYSFCLASLFDPIQADSTIIFGDGAIMKGLSTPLQIYNNHYYLELENITVGDKQLDIDPAVFKYTASGGGGTILDSGSTMSHFPRAAFDVLAKEVKWHLDEQFPPTKYVHDVNALCYSGYIYLVPEDFPSVILHFHGGVELHFDRYTFFRQVNPSQFCMAITVSNLGDTAIIGAYALQTYNIGIDTAQLKVYFWVNGC